MRSRVIFGIDDICPQKSADAGKDFGGDLQAGILGQLLDLRQDFPRIKVTLFITPNYSYKAQPRYFSTFQKILKKPFGKRFAASIAKKLPDGNFQLGKHPEFCNFLKMQEKKGIFSLELHGFDHFNPWLYYPQEFTELSLEKCNERIEKAVALFRKAGFQKPKVFAPPGWGFSGNLLEALRNNGIPRIAGSVDNSSSVSKDSFSKGSGLQCVSALFPQEANGLLNIPRNWDLRFGKLEKATQILQAGGILGVQAHAAEEGVENAITPENLLNLKNVLASLEKDFGNLRFAHFKEI